LGAIIQAEQKAEKSWYKVGTPDILVRSDNPDRAVRPLSAVSGMLAKLRPSGMVMLYCRKEDADRARKLVGKKKGGGTH
jgi:hypothetical protein